MLLISIVACCALPLVATKQIRCCNKRLSRSLRQPLLRYKYAVHLQRQSHMTVFKKQGADVYASAPCFAVMLIYIAVFRIVPSVLRNES